MDQGDLFGGDEPRRRARDEAQAFNRMRGANKAKATKARKLAEEGMNKATSKAEADNPGWKDAAYDKLQEFARRRTTFTGEEFKDWAVRDGLPAPANPSAWGGIMHKARRRGVVAFIGYVTANNPSRHSAPNRRWNSLLFDGATNG